MAPLALSAHIDAGEKDAVERLQRRLGFAARIGTRIVITNSTTLDRRDEFRRNVAELLPVAQECGVVIAFENPGHGTHNLIGSAADGVKLRAEFDSPWIGINYDTGNIFTYSEEATASGSRYRTSPGDRDAFPPEGHHVDPGGMVLHCDRRGIDRFRANLRAAFGEWEPDPSRDRAAPPPAPGATCRPAPRQDPAAARRDSGRSRAIVALCQAGTRRDVKGAGRLRSIGETCFRKASATRPHVKDVAGEGLPFEFGRVETLRRCRDVEGSQIRSPERNRGHVCGRQFDDAVEPAIRCDADDASATEPRIPEIAVGVDRRPVGFPGDYPFREKDTAIPDFACRPIEHIFADVALQAIGEVHPRAVGRPSDRIGNSHRRQHGVDGQPAPFAAIR